MIYSIGTHVRWSERNKSPRNGSQTGSLAREWERFEEFPWVLWDGAAEERKEYPECIQIVTSLADAWEEKEKARAR